MIYTLTHYRQETRILVLLKFLCLFYGTVLLSITQEKNSNIIHI